MSKFAGDGILQKYYIEKTDGSPVNPKAEYFVLRLDNTFSDGKDDETNKAHRNACRKAVLLYADLIKNHLPLLSDELIKRYSE